MNYTLDYYQILQVGKTATKEELKAAYRRLSKLRHPDKNPDNPTATEQFQLIQEAYGVLSNDISRHVYDEYRSIHWADTGRKAADESIKTSPRSKSNTDGRTAPHSGVYTNTRKVWREKRIYFKGHISVKFQAIPEMLEGYLSSREQNYTIHPTETLVCIFSSDVHKDGTPREYEQAYASADLFAVPLPQPLRCEMEMAGVREVYYLTIHDLKIKNPAIINITRHEQQNFGELTGDCFGYIVHRYEEDLRETITECYGATGKVETKEVAGVYFSRQEYYNKDCSFYWSEWSINTSATARSKTRTAHTARTYNYRSNLTTADVKYASWLVYLFIAFLIWPKLLLVVLVCLALLFLGYTLSKIWSRQTRVVGWFNGMLFIGLLILGLYSLFRPQPPFVQPTTSNYQPLDTRKVPLPYDSNDTLISHLVSWNDYASNHYRVELRILQSAVIAAHQQHESMPFAGLSAASAGQVYANMFHIDKGRLHYVYQAFDSIVNANRLNEMEAASMVVSCIQSIPYFLIMDGSCNAQYNDPFVSSFLNSCKGDCCLGQVKFGLQTPAEFVGNLKGDCDTRALVLFDILSHMGYDVAVLTSQVYQHALIAVRFKTAQPAFGLAFPLKAGAFYLWETTSTGHKPGIISTTMNNLQNWTASLVNQQ